MKVEVKVEKQEQVNSFSGVDPKSIFGFPQFPASEELVQDVQGIQGPVRCEEEVNPAPAGHQTFSFIQSTVQAVQKIFENKNLNSVEDQKEIERALKAEVLKIRASMGDASKVESDDHSLAENSTSLPVVTPGTETINEFLKNQMEFLKEKIGGVEPWVIQNAIAVGYYHASQLNLNPDRKAFEESIFRLWRESHRDKQATQPLPTNKSQEAKPLVFQYPSSVGASNPSSETSSEFLPASEYDPTERLLHRIKKEPEASQQPGSEKNSQMTSQRGNKKAPTNHGRGRGRRRGRLKRG